MSGHVSVIGAGPGDPGLISARGLHLIGLADVVVYDRLAAGLLRWARPDAEKIEAGGPAERSTAQDAISMLIADHARDGRAVARLKWGDPFVFDSGGKEALFLHEQRIPFEVVPGIPAAVGATAYAGIPLTYPGSGDAVVLLRGSEGTGEGLPDVDWKALVRLDGTIASTVSGRQAGAIIDALLSHGRAADTPAALIHHGTLATQRTIGGTLGELSKRLADQDAQAEGTLVIGEVASLRDHLRWFDERPLFGKRIVITRSHDQARELAGTLGRLGAQTIEAPLFRAAPADDPEAIDRAAASVDQQRWVVFTSANSVTRFVNALLAGPRDLRALGDVRVCAVGPTTVERLEARGIKPDAALPEVRIDAIVDAIAGGASLEGQRILLVRPDYLRDGLAIELARRGASVTDLVAYTTVAAAPESDDAQQIYRLLLDGQVDAVTFTNPTAVWRFADLVGREQAADLLNTTTVAVLGPVTREAAEQLGIHATLMGATHTVGALVNALVAHFETGREDTATGA